MQQQRPITGIDLYTTTAKTGARMSSNNEQKAAAQQQTAPPNKSNSASAVAQKYRKLCTLHTQ
jgi:hypothetical protein